MAKKSILARQKKREKLVARYARLRALLKKAGDYFRLDKLPKNASPVRLKKRCWKCGRGRFIIGLFKLCRICFKEKASKGEIPGVTKVSW